MRTTDEQMREILRRKEVYGESRALRRKMALEGTVCGVCAALMVTAVYFLPRVEGASGQTPIRQYGSMVLRLPAVGYAVIALLAFILGVAATLLCRHWRQHRQKEREL